MIDQSNSTPPTFIKKSQRSNVHTHQSPITEAIIEHKFNHVYNPETQPNVLSIWYLIQPPMLSLKVISET